MIESGDIAIMMVEAGGTEATWRLYEEGAPKVTEEVIADGLEEAKQWIKASIELQKELRAAVVLARGPIAGDPVRDPHRLRRRRVRDRRRAGHRVAPWQAMSIADKTERNDRLDEILEGLLLALCGTPEEPEPFAVARQADQAGVPRRCRRRSSAAASSTRACASTAAAPPTSVRSRAEVEILPTAHGSGLFQRGETQVLSVLTLGMPRMEQFIGLDELRGTTKRYIHHYNFPPYSTGETGRVGSPKRREIGHGALAERALVPGRPVDGGVALRAAHRLRRAQLERLHLHGVGVRLHALDDRRRRAAEGVGRRHRHGPRLRRGQVHDPHRHPRHRGRVRRHGLQGRGHARLRDRAAARHQDRRPSRRRAARGAAPGP